MLRSLALFALLLVPRSAIEAQVPGADPRLQATRAELEEAARVGGTAGSVAAARLKDGDLFPGDRVVISVLNETQLTDTFSVSPQRTLDLPELAPLPVAGLLRSEVEAKVTTHIARYVKDPVVRVRPLIRVIVAGGVQRPGVLNVPADALVSDLFDAAGGLSSDANLVKSKLLRNGTEIYDSKSLQRVIGTGLSLDRAGVKGGDQLVVAQRVPGGSLGTIAPVIGLVTGLVTTILFITN